MSRSQTIPTRARRERKGIVAVEAAFVLPVVLILMIGMWEVGRLVQVQQVVMNAAREGARLAAGGASGGVEVTNAMVVQAVRDYMTSAGFPAATVSGAQITLTCLASPTWTNPSDALPLDRFQVQVVIPSGTAFNSLKWTVLKLTSVNSLTVTVQWLSTNDAQVVVDSQLPY